MFRAFYSSDPDGLAKKRGLSLTLVKFAVDRLGGRLVVKSREGEGTSFVIYLPYEGSLESSFSSVE
ncbi:ATP-binding protein [Candidatus Margulisiibacteriota bacterium]